jgi:hypothetical protein
MKRNEFISIDDLEQFLREIVIEKGLPDNVDLIMKDIRRIQAGNPEDYEVEKSPLEFTGFEPTRKAK